MSGSRPRRMNSEKGRRKAIVDECIGTWEEASLEHAVMHLATLVALILLPILGPEWRDNRETLDACRAVFFLGWAVFTTVKCLRYAVVRIRAEEKTEDVFVPQLIVMVSLTNIVMIAAVWVVLGRPVL